MMRMFLVSEAEDTFGGTWTIWETNLGSFYVTCDSPDGARFTDGPFETIEEAYAAVKKYPD